jgi:hypothetical protein
LARSGNRFGSDSVRIADSGSGRAAAGRRHDEVGSSPGAVLEQIAAAGATPAEAAGEVKWLDTCFASYAVARHR